MTFAGLTQKLLDAATAGLYTSDDVMGLTYNQVVTILGDDGAGRSGGGADNMKHSVAVSIDATERQAKIDEVVAAVRLLTPQRYGSVEGRLQRGRKILELSLDGSFE